MQVDTPTKEVTYCPKNNNPSSVHTNVIQQPFS